MFYGESQNQLSSKRPLRRSPTYDPTPLCQLGHATKHHVWCFLKDLQKQCVHGLPGQPLQSPAAAESCGHEVGNVTEVRSSHHGQQVPQGCPGTVCRCYRL